MEINQTFGYLFLTLPRCIHKEKAPEGDSDVRMVLPDPVEDGGGFLEGQNDEQMLRLGTAAHGEG